MSCSYTPSQNGRVEHKYRHVTETSLALLFHSHIPPWYWVNAFSTVTYIINRLPMPVLSGLSPFEVLLSLLIMRISIPLVVVFTHAYRIMHLTNFLPVAYHVFLVIDPHIKASVVLTPQLLAHILHDMLSLMNIFSPFQILPVPLLLLTLVSFFFF